jgi:TM2 domain-containing membrane protein YozV
LLIFASSATVFSVLHHADHVIRGNHSGWPFQAEVTPFTFSLLIYALIGPAIYLTAKGRDVAGYHLFVAVVGLALIGTVHFVPTGGQESPIHDIYMVYGSPVAGTLALVVLAGLIISVALLAITAYGTLRARTRKGD